MSSYQHALLLSVCVLLSTESIRNVSAEVTKLNVENFEELTKGKNVFIKVRRRFIFLKFLSIV